ncbi:BrnA antitoxin family protein [bacterium]|nr:BrnA antitoxin family protein [bacterium]
MKKIPDPNKMKRIKHPVLDKENVKVRITTYIDEDVLASLKDVADQSGNKYQTLLNTILREYFFGEKKGILNRLSKLEKAVFKNAQRS